MNNTCARVPILINLVEVLEVKTYLELGVEEGLVFNRIAPLVGEAYAVDIKSGTYEHIRNNSNLIWHNTTSANFLRALDKNVMFDLVFIDADHTHKASLEDFMLVKDHVHPNGIICLHDALPYTPEMASPEWHPGLWCGEVYKTVDYIRHNLADEYELCTIPVDFGVTICRKLPKKLPWE